MNESRGYGLELPDPEDTAACRRFVGSSMRSFFEGCGFPTEDIAGFVGAYKETFSVNERYAVRPFPGIPEMLKELKGSGRRLGILTANIDRNVRAGLGESAKLFDWISDLREIEMFGSKGVALRAMINTHFPHAQGKVIYTGDMSSDYEASEKAGVGFVPVSWGWEDWSDRSGFAPVYSVEQLKFAL
ncbi:MAG: HAD hydrolase-like protein [archaeon]